MTRSLDDRPRSAPRWVRAAVLTGGFTSFVACGGKHPNGQPPTCGPCCHDTNRQECEEQIQRQQQGQRVDAGADAPAVPGD